MGECVDYLILLQSTTLTRQTLDFHHHIIKSRQLTGYIYFTLHTVAALVIRRGIGV